MTADPRIRLIRDDITTLEVDAIVNAANAELRGGGGVDGAIHAAAGPALLDACRDLGGCPPGEARATAGYALPAALIIHTVGPIWRGGDNGEDATLVACYRNSLALALELGARTIAFPSISTGLYGFPIRRAAAIALAAIREVLEVNANIDEVTLVCFNAANHEAYAELLAQAGKPKKR
ncbi:MAG: O-acetyl-ADP-ribose deacetylase [Chloroflexi bacterium]|nr:O-acetyl-ADP-ribose deacetylase [Chloroflexota bacterium]MDA1146292.1 O-acetyl-ADP-ribose deacetylase [Chloroflexota bacterium]